VAIGASEIQHGGNVDDEFLSKGENTGYNVKRYARTCELIRRTLEALGAGFTNESAIQSFVKIKMRK
jgi:hypothetical protein